MFVPLHPSLPLGDQLYAHLRNAISNGVLRPGERLPSTRPWAEQLGVSRNTVLLAYDRLASEGYVEGRGPRGTFVAVDIPAELWEARRATGARAGAGTAGAPRSNAGRPGASGGRLPSDTGRGARGGTSTGTGTGTGRGTGTGAGRGTGTGADTGAGTGTGTGGGADAHTPAPSQAPADPRLSVEGRAVSRLPGVFSPYSASSQAPLPFDFRHNIIVGDAAADRAWGQIFRRFLREPRSSWRGYERSAQDPELREALADHLGRTRGVLCRAEQVIVLSGSQAAFHLVAQLFLDPGDRVLMEASHYLGVRSSFLSRGARIIPVPVDDLGMRVDAIPSAAEGAKIAYVVPSHQWPLGGTLPFARRQRLLAWARRNGTVVLENDHNFEFRHGGPPVESLQALDVDGRVVHVGTFTRLRPGGLHVNYMVVPESWIDLFDAALSLSGSVASALEQRTLAAFVREGHLERLNRRARRRAREQREAMVDAVRNFLGERVHLRVPGAGFHVHVTLQTVRPREIDALLAVAANEGVRLYPDLPFHWKAPKHPGLILGFGDLTTARIDEGISRLARVLDERRWAGGGT